MSATVHIDTGGLTAFAVRLRELVASFPVEEKVFLEVCAEEVAVEARNLASGSAKVRSTIRVIHLPSLPGGRQAVAVGAGISGSGNAGLYPLLREGGNGATKFAFWEHPVFGNTSTLVTQMSKPYLTPALRDKEAAFEVIAGEAIERQLEMELDGKFS